MAHLSSVIWYINLIFVQHSHGSAFLLCASGYNGTNKYLYGLNTFWLSFETSETIYYSESLPVLADRTVYIWKNETDGCLKFVTLPTTDGGARPSQTTVGYIVFAYIFVQGYAALICIQNDDSCFLFHLQLGDN